MVNQRVSPSALYMFFQLLVSCWHVSLDGSQTHSGGFVGLNLLFAATRYCIGWTGGTGFPWVITPPG